MWGASPVEFLILTVAFLASLTLGVATAVGVNRWSRRRWTLALAPVFVLLWLAVGLTPFLIMAWLAFRTAPPAVPAGPVELAPADTPAATYTP